MLNLPPPSFSLLGESYWPVIPSCQKLPPSSSTSQGPFPSSSLLPPPPFPPPSTPSPSSPSSTLLLSPGPGSFDARSSIQSSSVFDLPWLNVPPLASGVRGEEKKGGEGRGGASGEVKRGEGR
eukprot:749788-Hanusia_phi.AAC.1